MPWRVAICATAAASMSSQSEPVRWCIASSRDGSCNQTSAEAIGPVQMSYTLGAESVVRVDLMDASGRLLSTFALGLQGTGQHTFVWDRKDSKGREMAAGIYFLTLDTGGSRTTRGVVLLK